MVLWKECDVDTFWTSVGGFLVNLRELRCDLLYCKVSPICLD